MTQRKHLNDIEPQLRKISLIDEEVVDHPLCLCEYYNKKNQRSHILMCCCNCDALDTFCTSCLCCCCDENDPDAPRSIFSQSFKDALDDIQDRVRIPFPGGARKINLDYFMTILALFIFIKIGTIGFFFSLLSIFILPLIIYPLFFMKRAARRSKSVKIGFFLILNTLIANIYILNFKMEYMNGFNRREFYTLNFLLLGALVYLFVMKNSNPGLMKARSSSEQFLTDDYCKKCRILKDKTKDNYGHCPQCSKCIYKRDHHCFWIDNCIGYLNHKKFLCFIVYLLVIFLYSMNFFFNVLNRVECKFWSNCLSVGFYENFSISYISLMTVQLMPLTCYMILLIIQQLLFISVGMTQYQLFRQSQKNIRFSLILFLADNLTLTKSLANLKIFFFKKRTQTDIEKQSTKSFLTV